MCNIEVSFVLDASDSISPAFFIEEKKFITDLVKTYSIRPYGNRASVALFSNSAVEAIYCDEYQDEKSFSEAVGNLQQIGKFTNIEDGIIKGQHLLQVRGCGNRPDVIKIMVILTDGNANIGNSKNLSDGPKDLAYAAQKARDSGIIVFAVAVGKNSKQESLLILANATDRIIKANSFDQLLKTSALKKLLMPNCIFNSTSQSLNKLLTNISYASKSPFFLTTKSTLQSLTTESVKPLNISTTKFIQLNEKSSINYTTQNGIKTIETKTANNIKISMLINPTTQSNISDSIAKSVNKNLDNKLTPEQITLSTIYLVNTKSEPLNKTNQQNNENQKNSDSAKNHLINRSSTIKNTPNSNNSTKKKRLTKIQVNNNTNRKQKKQPSITNEKVITKTNSSNTKIKELKNLSTPLFASTTESIIPFETTVSTRASANRSTPEINTLGTEPPIKSTTESQTQSVEPTTEAAESTAATTKELSNATTPPFESTTEAITQSEGPGSTSRPPSLATSETVTAATETLNTSTAEVFSQSVEPTAETTGRTGAETTESLGAVPTTSFPPTEPVSHTSRAAPTNCKIEISFVLDASDSIGPSTFKVEKKFVQDLAKTFGISDGGNRGSVVLFSDKASESIFCDEYQDAASFNKAVDELVQSGKFTNIEDGIEKGTDILQKRGCGSRPDAVPLMLIFTDGVANIGNSANPLDGPQGLALAAKAARDSAIKIFAIAVGNKVEEKALLVLTNDTSRIVKAHSFSQLLNDDVLQSMVAAFCTNSPITLATSSAITDTEPPPSEQTPGTATNAAAETTLSSHGTDAVSKQSTEGLTVPSESTAISSESEISTTAQTDATSAELLSTSSTESFTEPVEPTSEASESPGTMTPELNNASTPLFASTTVSITPFETTVSTRASANRSTPEINTLGTEPPIKSTTESQTQSVEPTTEAAESTAATTKELSNATTPSFESTTEAITQSEGPGSTSRPPSLATSETVTAATETLNTSTAEVFSQSVEPTAETTGRTGAETTESLGAVPTTSFPPTEPVSHTSRAAPTNCKIEISFVLDASDSIGPSTFKVEKKFVQDLAKTFGISDGGNRGSVVLFSDKASESIFCDEYQDAASFNKAVDELVQSGKFTNIEDGIEKGTDILQKRGCGSRPDAVPLMLIFTDGVANIGNSANPLDGPQGLALAAKAARDSAIKIFAIAVGNKVEEKALLVLTNDTSRIVKAHSFSQLLNDDVLQSMVAAFCTNSPITLATSSAITDTEPPPSEQTPGTATNAAAETTLSSHGTDAVSKQSTEGLTVPSESTAISSESEISTTAQTDATSAELLSTSSTESFTEPVEPTSEASESPGTMTPELNNASTPLFASTTVSITPFETTVSTRASANRSTPEINTLGTEPPIKSTTESQTQSVEPTTEAAESTAATTKELSNATTPSFESTTEAITQSEGPGSTSRPPSLATSETVTAATETLNTSTAEVFSQSVEPTAETTGRTGAETTESLGAVPTTSFPPTEPVSHTSRAAPTNCKIEISFVLDASDSIGPSTFKVEKKFVQDLAKTFGISDGGNRGSVVLFSDKASESIFCDEYQDAASFNKAVDELVQSGKFTNIEDGIEKGTDILQKRGCGSRPDAVPLMLIFTDGVANIGNSANPLDGPQGLALAAKAARDSAIKIFAIAVGNKVEEKALLVLTNDTSRIVKAHSFSQLLNDDVLQSMVAAFCTNSPITLATSSAITDTEPPPSEQTPGTATNAAAETTLSSHGTDAVSKQSTEGLTVPSESTAISSESEISTTAQTDATSAELLSTSSTESFTEPVEPTSEASESPGTMTPELNNASTPLFASTTVSITPFETTVSTRASANRSTPEINTLGTEPPIKSTTESQTQSVEPTTEAAESTAATTKELSNATTPSFESTTEAITQSEGPGSTSRPPSLATSETVTAATETLNTSTAEVFSQSVEPTAETTGRTGAETTESLGAVPTTSFPPTEPVSHTSRAAPTNCKIEISFVLDASDSIGPSTFKVEKKFVQDLAKTFGISDGGNRGSVVLFSDKASESIFCDEYQDAASFNKAVDELVQSGKFTNIEDGIEKGTDILQKRGCGSRPDAVPLMLIFTDGVANIGNSANPLDGPQGLALAAKAARDSAIKIFAIAVGNKVEEKALLVLTNDTSRIVKAHSFSQLLNDDVLQSMVAAFCTNSPITLATSSAITDTEPPPSEQTPGTATNAAAETTLSSHGTDAVSKQSTEGLTVPSESTAISSESEISTTAQTDATSAELLSTSSTESFTEPVEPTSEASESPGTMTPELNNASTPLFASTTVSITPFETTVSTRASANRSTPEINTLGTEPPIKSTTESQTQSVEPTTEAAESTAATTNGLSSVTTPPLEFTSSLVKTDINEIFTKLSVFSPSVKSQSTVVKVFPLRKAFLKTILTKASLVSAPNVTAINEHLLNYTTASFLKYNLTTVEAVENISTTGRPLVSNTFEFTSKTFHPTFINLRSSSNSLQNKSIPLLNIFTKNINQTTEPSVYGASTFNQAMSGTCGSWTSGLQNFI